MSDSHFEIDFFDHRQTQRLWELLANLRAVRSVAREKASGYWFTLRYSSTHRVFSDYRSFLCTGGNRSWDADLHPEDRLLGETDPPEHHQMRKLLVRVFNPQTAADLEDFARKYAAERFDAIEAAGGGELVGDLSRLLQTAVTARLIGFPKEDTLQIAEWVSELMHCDWPTHNVQDKRYLDQGVGLEGSAPELCAYILENMERRRDPVQEFDDLLAELVHAEMDDEPLSQRRIRTLVVNFLTGGLSTTNLLSNLAYRLMTDRELNHSLQRNRRLVPLAVEECLRLDPPVMFLFRTAAEDLKVDDADIKKGERVVMCIASANRDERMFEDPETFNMERDRIDRHLSFGGGAHLCLGNTISRMEARVMVEAFVDRYGSGGMTLRPGFELRPMAHYLEFGPERLDVLVRG